MLTIVPFAEDHVAELATLEQSCFSTPWSADALREERHNPHAIFRVAEQNGVVVGYIGMHHLADEGFITNVAVAPTARRQGVADALLDAVLTYGRENKLYRLTLEVRPSNAAALSLYQKHGFICDGIRPRFYQKPAEDAAIYSYYYTAIL